MNATVSVSRVLMRRSALLKRRRDAAATSDAPASPLTSTPDGPAPVGANDALQERVQERQEGAAPAEAEAEGAEDIHPPARPPSCRACRSRFGPLAAGR